MINSIVFNMVSIADDFNTLNSDNVHRWPNRWQCWPITYLRCPTDANIDQRRQVNFGSDHAFKIMLSFGKSRPHMLMLIRKMLLIT